MQRDRVSAIGDLTTAAQEMRLIVAHVETREDEFGRRDRLLRALLQSNPRESGRINTAAVRVMEIFSDLGWDCVLHLDSTNAPAIVVRLD